MITTEFIQGKREAYYEVKVSINRDNTTLESYSFGLCTKADYDAVLSALRASLKDSYKLDIWIGRGLHSEYESLDSACATLSRLRFVEYSTKTVEKVVYVKESVKTEL